MNGSVLDPGDEDTSRPVANGGDRETPDSNIAKYSGRDRRNPFAATDLLENDLEGFCRFGEASRPDECGGFSTRRLFSTTNIHRTIAWSDIGLNRPSG